MIWHGIAMNACWNVRNSILSTARFSAVYCSPHRPSSGSISANQALSVHASDAITMFDQLLLSTTIVGQQHQLGGRGGEVVGEVERTPDTLPIITAISKATLSG